MADCADCGGKGWYWADRPRGGRQKIDCAVCGGSGKYNHGRASTFGTAIGWKTKSGKDDGKKKRKK